MKKIILNSPKFKSKNSLFLPVLLLFTMFHFANNVYGQSKIDKLYSFNDSITGNNIDYQCKVDFSTCKSNCDTANGHYVAVTSFKDLFMGNNLYQIKLIEFNKNGSIIQSKVIRSIAILDFVVTDIKQLVSKSGYILVGYIDPLSANQPIHPFSMIVNNNFQPQARKIYEQSGMFSRVGVLQNNSFVFVGFSGDSTDANSDKSGLLVYSNLNFTLLNSWIIPTAYISQSFTNVNDIYCLNNSESIISSSLMQINNGSANIVTSIMKINHTNGNIIWQNNNVGGLYTKFTNPKLDIANDRIYVTVNSEVAATGAILKYNLSTGNYIGGAFFEGVEFFNCADISTGIHIPYFQNIKHIGGDTVRVTGKFVLTDEFMFDFKVYMPDFLPSVNWVPFNAHVNYTNYQSVNTDLTGYFSTVGKDTGFRTELILPIYSTNNTYFNTDSNFAISVTYSHLQNSNPGQVFKTWTFTHAYSNAYGYNNINITNAGSLYSITRPNFYTLSKFISASPMYLKSTNIIKDPNPCNSRKNNMCCH